MSVTSGGLNIITTGSGEQVISTGLYKQGKMVLTMVNIASVTDGDNVAKTVFINDHPVYTLASRISCSNGDEIADSGLISGTTGGIARPIMGSNKLFIEGQPAVRSTDLFEPNNGNTAPVPIM